MKTLNTYKLVATSIMATFVTFFTFLGINIPIGTSNTLVHLGQIMCLLSGIFLGPIYGGLASAVGSFTYDVLNPMFISSAPFTFVFKFLQGYVCGLITHMNNKNGESLWYNIIGTSVASLLYIMLRVLKFTIINLYFIKMDLTTILILASKMVIFSIVKSIITIIIVVFIVPIIKKRIKFI